MKFVNETLTLEKHKENNNDENLDLKSCIEKMSDEELIERLNNIKEVDSYTEIDIIIEEIQKRNLDFSYKVKKNSFIILWFFNILMSLFSIYFIIVNIMINDLIGFLEMIIFSLFLLTPLTYSLIIIFTEKIDLCKEKIVIKGLFSQKEINLKEILMVSSDEITLRSEKFLQKSLKIKTNNKLYVYFGIKKESIYIIKKLINK